jgi:vacuolar-type H+-ATPase subunit H
MNAEAAAEEVSVPVELDVVFEELRKAEEKVAQAKREAEKILQRAKEEAERILQESVKEAEQEPDSFDAGAELVDLESEIASRLERVKRVLEERGEELREMVLIALLEWW